MKYIKYLICSICSLALAVLFAGYSAVWLWYSQVRFAPLEECIPINYGLRIVSIGDYSYSATSPKCLEFGGNLALTNEETQEGLILWPQLSGDCKLAALIYLNEDDEALAIVMIDKDGNCLDESRKNAYDKNKQRVAEMIDLADEMWHIK